jgi:zinc transporter ZupT
MQISLLFCFYLILHVVVTTTEGQAECGGHGRLHGSHCHCEVGYKSKGTTCLPVNGAESITTCPAGGIQWEMSIASFFKKGSYMLEMTDNTESIATFMLPISNISTVSEEEIEKSIETANTLLEDVTLPRKVLKKNQVLVPSSKLLYILARSNTEELAKLQEECEATPGNTWHIDHCDGLDGHSRLLKESSISLFNVTILEDGFYALHMQHQAIKEFGMRILNDESEAIEPIILVGEKDNDNVKDNNNKSAGKRASAAIWAKTMGAVTVVALLSLLGIFLLLLKRSVLQDFIDAFIAISAGALFGAAFMHILPESIEFYNEYGQMDMHICGLFTAGFMTAMVLEMLLEIAVNRLDGEQVHAHHESLKIPEIPTQSPLGSPTAYADLQVDQQHRKSGLSVHNRPNKWSLKVQWTRIKPMAYIVLLGDLFHNFVDGVLIATAFLACDDALGIAVMVSAILHELPQEIADFVILVDSGFTYFQAIFFNFISALSSYLGAFIILASITVTNSSMGLLLAYGAGTLVYIATTDLLPRVLRVKTLKEFFLRLFLFAVGMGALALTTLYHVHCEIDD